MKIVNVGVGSPYNVFAIFIINIAELARLDVIIHEINDTLPPFPPIDY